MNPALWLSRTAHRRPSAPALMRGTEVLANYSQFAGNAAAIGAGLQARGTTRGDRVALFMSNSTEYLEALYGIWWMGAVAVPINAKLHPKEAAWIITKSGAKMVFTDGKSEQSLAAVLDEGVQSICTPGPEFDAMRAAPSNVPPTMLDSDDVIWLFYTSGTTGRPKGVMITCGNIAAMAFSYFADVDDVHPEDAILYAAPMSHGAGLYNFMHVLRGARHVVPPSGGFDAGEILDLGVRVGPVSMFAAPTMVRRLVDRAKVSGRTGEGLRTIVYAGGPMYEADILDAVQVMGPRFVQIYGQGECPMGITALSRTDVADRSDPRWRARLNSVGIAQSAVEVAILDTAGRPLPPGETGEIAVRGATVMAGYWQNPEATAKTIRDGWLWTGDVGSRDPDGYITMNDRSKDVIISGGTNIYPREIEEVLLSHDCVHEVAVIGQRDPEWGEIVVAFVVCQPESEIREAELDSLCIDRIARFKRPKVYHFVTELPKNNYGKILKTALRKLVETEH